MNLLNYCIKFLGASSGIGRETAIQFCKHGAHLSLAGRNAERLEKTAKECEEVRSQNDQQIMTFAGDLSEEKNVEKLLNNTIERYKQLDVLVNNAGIIDFGTIETTKLEQYDRVMNLNLRSIFQLTSLAIPYLIQTKGIL